MHTTNPTIYIIGAGAIGKALAVFLSYTGKKVILLHGRDHDKKEYTETIQVAVNKGEIVKSNIHISTVNNYAVLDGIIILTTKSFSNHQMADNLKDRVGDSPIVVLQNGLHVENPFISYGFTEIYRCVLFASSQHIETHQLKFKPASNSPIGVIKGNIPNLTAIVKSLNNPYLVFTPEEDIQPVIWSKAILNCVFNSLCPLLEIDNGIFKRNEKALQLAKQVIDECIVIAAAEGIHLKAETLLEKLLLISSTSEGQLISTYQDILHKRKTEIETFNIEIGRIAGQYQKNEQSKITKFLGELIEIKSAINQ
ncbi:ketopantoate reductase family protein [Sediminibacterium goheungense]|uniref:2-dehydropantoate 2-reductase n=1 Tax=Sediminibacterium goheungense TaxID=1086393 RepID=A0A4R6IMR9_9BACT|nr:2-dehydropantoate 2-reductase [Sediminibacterium goheungense]TDO23494.1 2-dehydropantoate 2-reductase [Sediminibacterium goheungense]TDO25097.1 ketopantoate reductase [Sediminibacterium goheungense]